MKKLSLLILILSFLWVGSCSSEDDVSGGVTGVSLDKTSLTLHTGTTGKLTAVIAPADAKNRAVTWSSSNTGIATVSGGTVSAIAEGKATVTVTTVDGGKTANCEVTVIHQNVTGVSLDKTSLSLIIGKPGRGKLNAIVAPVNASDKTVSWSSSNTGIATVSGGTVTAVAAGTVTITVTTNDTADDGQKKTAECTVTIKPAPQEAGLGAKDSLSGKTAAQYFEEKKLYIGWNLGNGFDAGSGYGGWTQKISQDFLPMIKQNGYNMVRIPVTWNTSTNPILTRTGSNNTDPFDYSTFNEANFKTTLAEVKQVVDWAYSAGLVAIINIHHDGSGTNNWLSITKAAANNINNSINTGMTSVFTKIWELLAEEFKDYGDWLIFEPFNELHNNGWGWGDINPDEFTVINNLNQIFTNTVRAAGGKNTERFLVIQPYCAKPHQAMASTFVLPTDSTANKQIVSMHYYDPEGFALHGRGGPNWGTDANKNELSAAFLSYAQKFTQKNIPVILGESGATFQNQSDPEQRALAHANRVKYFEFMCSEARKNKIVPVYWDNGSITGSGIGENFGLFNRGTGALLEDFTTGFSMGEILDAMISAAWNE